MTETTVGGRIVPPVGSTPPPAHKHNVTDLVGMEAGTIPSGSVPTFDGVAWVPSIPQTRSVSIPNPPTFASTPVTDISMTPGFAGATVYITCTLTNPTTNTDSTAFNGAQSYAIRWRYESQTNKPWTVVTSLAATANASAGSTGGNVITFYDVTPGQNVSIEAAVTDVYGNASAWSTPAVTIQAKKDDVAPNRPSTATVTSYLGGVQVRWNGLDYAGAAMPSDFAYTEIHIGTTSTFTPSSATKADVLTGAGQAILFKDGGGNPLVFGGTYYIKLIAVDTSGNASTSSTVSSAVNISFSVNTATGIGTLGANMVGFNARAIGGITTTVGGTAPSSPVAGDIWLDNSGSGITQKQYSGTAWTTIQLNSNSLAANSITATQLAAGAIAAGSAVIGDAAIRSAQIISLAAGQISAGILTANVAVAGQFSTSQFDDQSNWKTITSITGAGGTTMTVTTSAAHGLVLNDYVTISGSGYTVNNGFFKVTAVSSPTVFAVLNTNGTVQNDTVGNVIKWSSKVVMNSSGISAYGSDSNTAKVSIKSDGSFSFATSLNSSAARMTFDASGLKVYNSANPSNPTVSIDANGSATFTGSITSSTVSGSTMIGNTIKTANLTPSDGNYIEINSSGIAGYKNGLSTPIFSVANGAAFFTGSISGSTITGGTIQTSTTGAFVKLAEGARSAFIDLSTGSPYEYINGWVTSQGVTFTDAGDTWTELGTVVGSPRNSATNNGAAGTAGYAGTSINLCGNGGGSGSNRAHPYGPFAHIELFPAPATTADSKINIGYWARSGSGGAVTPPTLNTAYSGMMDADGYYMLMQRNVLNQSRNTYLGAGPGGNVYVRPDANNGGVQVTTGDFSPENDNAIKLGSSPNNRWASVAAYGNITSATGTISGAAISSTGSISGGAITGTSLSVAGGNISGGAITGSSLSVNNGNISAGNGTISGGAFNGTSATMSGVISGGAVTSGGSILTTTGTVSGYNVVSSNGRLTWTNPTAGPDFYFDVFGTSSSYGSLWSSDGNYVLLSQTGGATFLGSSGTIYNNGNTLPATDQNLTLGSASRRWASVWSIDTSINSSSDQRLKSDIVTVEDSLGIDFIKALRPVTFRMIENGKEQVLDSDGKPVINPDNPVEYLYTPTAGVRQHTGFIAQEVKAAFESTGVDDWAGWTLDDKDDPNSRQALRYGELIAPLVSAVQKLDARLTALETAN